MENMDNNPEEVRSGAVESAEMEAAEKEESENNLLTLTRMGATEMEAAGKKEPENSGSGGSGSRLPTIMGIIVLLVLALSVAVVGYSYTHLSQEESNTVIGKGSYDVNRYMKLGDYMNMTIEKSAVEADDASIQERVDALLSANTTTKEVKDRAVKDGDIVNIDYVGKVDGKEFDGGSAEGYSLTIGSGGFIDGFESGLVGVKIGKTVKLNLTFPDPYQNNPDLAGKKVEFTVTVNSIQESVKPEYTDKFVKSATDYDSIKAYEASIREELEQTNLENAVYSKVMEEADVKGYPQSLIDYYYNSVKEYYSSMAEANGQTLDSLLESSGLTEDSFREMINADLETAAKQDMMFEIVEKEQNIELDDEGFKNYVNDMVSAYGMTAEDYLAAAADDQKSALEEQYLREKTIDLLVEHTTVE